MADKWKPYILLCKDLKNPDESMNTNDLNIKTISIQDKVEKSIEGKVLDKMNINKICCRRMILTHVPLISYIN